MPMPAWPDTGPTALPSYPLMNSLQETMPDVTLRTEMDQGPAKVRQRFTAGVATLQCELMMQSAQVDRLDTFYNLDLGGGVAKFTWAHPRSGVSKVFRFVSPPKYSQSAKGAYKVALNLEILPEDPS